MKLFAVFVLSVLLLAPSVLSLSLHKSKKPSGSGSAAAAASTASSGSSAAGSAATKAEDQARHAMEAATQAADDERVANALLNGEVPAETTDKTREALNLLREQTLCTNEMRAVLRRNREHPGQTQAARAHSRATDIIVQLPHGTDGLQGLLAIHSDLVKAGCRVTDHWCSFGHCFFRTCFCLPITAEQPKRPLVQSDISLQKNDAALARDATLVKENEIKAEDKGKEGKAAKLEKTEQHVEKKMEKNKKVEKDLKKAEDHIDQKAAGAELGTACPPGYKIIPSQTQSFCKKAVFEGPVSFERTPGSYPQLPGTFATFNY